MVMRAVKKRKEVFILTDFVEDLLLMNEFRSKRAKV